jgi:hypothetical protein
MLNDIDVESEDFVGMADDNMGPSPLAATRVPRKVLSPIPEAGKSSRAPTLKRPRSLTPAEVEKEIGSSRSRAFEAPEASGFESTTEIQRRGQTGSSGGDWPSLAETSRATPLRRWWISSTTRLCLKRDITLRGVAEEMLTMQCLVGIH